MFWRRSKPAPPPALPRLDWQALPGDALEGRAAMWQPSEGEPDFASSRTFALLNAIYARFDPVATYACAEVARVTGWVTGPAVRVHLPDRLATALVRDGRGTRFVVSALDEKGVRLHFEPTVAPADREAALEGWLRHLEAWHALLDAGRIPPDGYGGEAGVERPSGWWGLASTHAASLAASGHTTEAFGVLLG